eukprot:g78113.t1
MNDSNSKKNITMKNDSKKIITDSHSNNSQQLKTETSTTNQRKLPKAFLSSPPSARQDKGKKSKRQIVSFSFQKLVQFAEPEPISDGVVTHEKCHS